MSRLIKGKLRVDILTRFFFCSTLALVPLSLPLTVLLTTLVAFNGFNRECRLLSVGTTNVPLLEVVHPLVVFYAFLYYASFCFRGIVTPGTRVGLLALLMSVGRASPRLSVPRNMFCSRVRKCGVCMGRGSHRAKVLGSMLVCGFSSKFRGTRVV